MNRSYRR